MPTIRLPIRHPEQIGRFILYLLSLIVCFQFCLSKDVLRLFQFEPPKRLQSQYLKHQSLQSGTVNIPSSISQPSYFKYLYQKQIANIGFQQL